MVASIRPQTLVAIFTPIFPSYYPWRIGENKRLWKSCRSWCDNQYIKYTALLFPFPNGRGCFLLSRLESKHTTRFDSMVFVMQHSGALKPANTHGNPKKKTNTPLTRWAAGIWPMASKHYNYLIKTAIYFRLNDLSTPPIAEIIWVKMWGQLWFVGS